jgi:hypothetical protein
LSIEQCLDLEIAYRQATSLRDVSKRSESGRGTSTIYHGETQNSTPKQRVRSDQQAVGKLKHSHDDEGSHGTVCAAELRREYDEANDSGRYAHSAFVDTFRHEVRRHGYVGHDPYGEAYGCYKQQVHRERPGVHTMSKGYEPEYIQDAPTGSRHINRRVGDRRIAMSLLRSTSCHSYSSS